MKSQWPISSVVRFGSWSLFQSNSDSKPPIPHPSSHIMSAWSIPLFYPCSLSVPIHLPGNPPAFPLPTCIFFMLSSDVSPSSLLDFDGKKRRASSSIGQRKESNIYLTNIREIEDAGLSLQASLRYIFMETGYNPLLCIALKAWCVCSLH